MSTKSIDKAEWEDFFNKLGKAAIAHKAEIDVQALGVFDKVAARCAVMKGISYDPKDDVLSVSCEGIDHIISQPQEITVTEGSEGLESVETVSEKDAYKSIIKFTRPVAI